MGLRPAMAVAAALAAATALGLGPAAADLIPLPTTTTTAPTTTAPPASTTTTRPTPTATTTTTTGQPASSSTTVPPPASGPAGGSSAGSPIPGPLGVADTVLPNGDVALARPATGAVPADIQALIDSVKRTPPGNTQRLLDAIAPLVDLGLSNEQAASLGMGRFPVGGKCVFSDDWLVPRFSEGKLHLHQGNDLFAPLGTPVRAPIDGVIRQNLDSLGGNVDYVTGPDGTYFYLAHLSAYVPGQTSGQHVKTGDVIGYVGNSGDARGGPTHVHFEVHPRGGPATDPKPFLDFWLADALAHASQVVAAYQASLPRAVLDLGLTRQLDGTLFSAPAFVPETELLWESAISPAGAAVELAIEEARRALAVAAAAPAPAPG
jgi:peptidoglycan LD-endopeptidase LytH